MAAQVSRRSWVVLHGALALGAVLIPRDWAQGPVASDWARRVQADVERQEYGFDALEAGLFSAPNRAQDLRLRVSAQGLEVFPRSTSAEDRVAPWRLALCTRSFGRGREDVLLPPAHVSVRGERAELDRGALVEWLENRPEGIEQGWTIPARPPGGEPLWIGLAVAGDLGLRIEPEGRSAIFVDARGDVRLRYRDLLVNDASGRALAARLAPSPAGFGIEIDDLGALYPLRVDPLLTGPVWTAEGDQTNAQLGRSVAPAGDVDGDGYPDVLVGAPGYTNGQSLEGRAFLYRGSPSGLASSPAWTVESNASTAQFGWSVATAGDVNGDGYSDVIVGASTLNGHGGAFLYLGSATGLATAPSWTAEGTQAGAYFGFSVSTAGDVNGDGYSDVIVGAWRDDNGETDEGRAFVYLGSAGGLASSAAWIAEGGQLGAFLGFSVSTAGDVNGDGYSDVIVGAYGYDGGQADEGRALLFLGSAGGLATSAVWSAESDQANARFGWSVATAGDVNGDGRSDVIVGAYQHSNGQSLEGRASLYLGTATGLAASASWTAEGEQGAATFGRSVASAGDVNGDGYSDVIVGAPLFDGSLTDEGRVFVYAGSPGGLETSPRWTTDGAQASADLGWSVASAGDVNADGYSDVVVGAYLHDNGQTDEGRAYAFHGSASGLATSPAWTGESHQAGAAFGWWVATAGDVNGDGHSDVLVGAPQYDDGQLDEGRAFLYLGTPSGLATTAAWTASGEQSSAYLGAVATAGDVNGDGYADVLVGAWLYDAGQTNEGRVQLYLGSAAGLSPSPAWTAEGNQANATFGWSLATAGDVNGDGRSDVILGAPHHDGPLGSEGRAYLYLGTPAGLASAPAWILQGEQGGEWLGTSVASAGDVNADGHSDVLVGANFYDGGELNEGRALLFLGSPQGLAATPAWTVEGEQSGAELGWCVATAGDVNGDGCSDVLVGALHHDDSFVDEGRASLYLGSPGGLATSAAWTVLGGQASAILGASLGTAGDVNGDGYADVVVGSENYDNGQTNEGRVLVFLGSASGLAATPAWAVESDQASANLGFCVATAGDVNADGYADVIAGAYAFDGGQTDEGRAFLFLGNDNRGHGGLVHALQQRRRDDSAPIALLGNTAPTGLFLVRAALGTSLLGFAWASPQPPVARIEWEVKPLGVAFDGSDLQHGPWLALSLLGPTTFEELATARLTAPKRHATGTAIQHWRARFATGNPLYPYTAWFGPPGNTVTEAKLRKPAVIIVR